MIFFALLLSLSSFAHNLPGKVTPEPFCSHLFGLPKLSFQINPTIDLDDTSVRPDDIQGLTLTFMNTSFPFIRKNESLIQNKDSSYYEFHLKGDETQRAILMLKEKQGLKMPWNLQILEGILVIKSHLGVPSSENFFVYSVRLSQGEPPQMMKDLKKVTQPLALKINPWSNQFQSQKKRMVEYLNSITQRTYTEPLETASEGVKWGRDQLENLKNTKGYQTLRKLRDWL